MAARTEHDRPGRVGGRRADTVRRRGGALSSWHPVDLSAELLCQFVARNQLDGALIDDVILGCNSQVGRRLPISPGEPVLAAGWPESVPGATVDRHAVSGAQAVHWAAQAVMSGTQNLVIAGGVEVMTAVPLGASLAVPSVGKPYGLRLQARYKEGGGLLPPGLVAEELAFRWALSRRDLDEWALVSRDRARLARSARRRTWRPSRSPASGRLAKDEAVGQPLPAVKVAALSPAFRDDGVVTAANIAAEGDAAAVLIASPARARALSLTPKGARVVRHRRRQPRHLAHGHVAGRTGSIEAGLVEWGRHRPVGDIREQRGSHAGLVGRDRGRLRAGQPGRGGAGHHRSSGRHRGGSFRHRS